MKFSAVATLGFLGWALSMPAPPEQAQGFPDLPFPTPSSSVPSFPTSIPGLPTFPFPTSFPGFPLPSISFAFPFPTPTGGAPRFPFPDFPPRTVTAIPFEA